MAKERNLPQKTTFTSSDFIRVVGSDNASYKQQVSNVASVAVENAYLTPPTALSSGADLLTLAIGVYYAPSNDIANSLVNKPSGLSLNCRVEVLSRIPARREIIVTDVNNVWENQMDSASTWTGWKKRPTREEIDALNSKIRDSLIRQYRTGEKSKINIAANGTSSVDGILTRYDGANLSVYAFHAYTPNGSSFSEAAGVDVKTGQAWSELSTSGGNLVLTVGQYKAGLLTLAYTSGHEPTITYV